MTPVSFTPGAEGAARPDGPGSRASTEPSGLGPPGFDPSRDEDYYDDDQGDCWNCGGEGYVYGCSWDWQCDTYDEGEGTCLCTRPCHICHPPKHDPELRRVLARALASGIEAGTGETRSGSTAQPQERGPQGDAQSRGEPS